MAWTATGFSLESVLQQPVGYFNDDSIQAVYLHDQVHRALGELQLTMPDPLQFWPIGFHPTGTHGGNVLEMLVSGVVRPFSAWPGWWSLGALVWIPLNLLAALPLGAHLWPARPVVTVSMAAAWAVMPALMGQMAAGRLTQVAVVGVPFAVLGLVRLAEKGGRWPVVVTAAGVALTGLGYWFYAVFVAFVAPVFWWWGARTRGARPVFADLARAAVGAAVMVAPFVALTFYERHGHGLVTSVPLQAAFTSPDFPDALRLAGEQVRHVRGWMPPVVLVGALFGLWRGTRRPLWAGAAALCTVFALGPGQHLGDHLWLLPAWPAWRWLPGMDAMSHPERWLAVGGLFWLLLAADGFARIGRWGQLCALGLPLGVLHANQAAGHLPLPTFQLNIPAVWRDVARTTRGATVPGIDSPPASWEYPGAVIVLPIGHAQNACAVQPFVPRPLLGGMVENLPWFRPPQWVDYVNDHALLRSMAALSAGKDREVVAGSADVEALIADGFALVLLDQALWDAHFVAARVPVRARLEAALGAPAFTDGSGAWWRLADVAAVDGKLGAADDFTFGEKGPPGPDPKAMRGAGPTRPTSRPEAPGGPVAL